MTSMGAISSIRPENDIEIGFREQKQAVTGNIETLRPQLFIC